MAPKIIIDTDPGVDDVLALLLLLASPEVSIELITINFGNTTQERAYLNILKLYSLVRKHVNAHPEALKHYPNFGNGRRPRLARGAVGPLEGSIDLAEYFHGPDGLSDITTSHPHFDALPEIDYQEDLNIISEYASDAILSTLANEPEKSVIILTLGPLTNLAQALRKDPHTLARAARIITMGGTLDAPGNTSPSSEFNFFADPFAAEEVLKAATRREINFFLMPLDVTFQHTIPFASLIREPLSIVNDRPNVIRDFTDAILSRPRLVLKALGLLEDQFEMHDPLAAYFAVDHAGHDLEDLRPGWVTSTRKFVIERKGEWTKGMCVVDRRGTLEEAGNVRSKDGMVSAEVNSSRDATKSEDRVLSVRVVTRTPGPTHFEKIFLERVYQ